jgi:hypothetical protein
VGFVNPQPDVVNHEIGHSDVRNLLLRSVKLFLGDENSLESNAPESVHIGLTESWKNPGEYILSLVNTSAGPVRPVRKLQSYRPAIKRSCGFRDRKGCLSFRY